MKRAFVVASLLVVFVATLLATLPVAPAVRWMLAPAHLDPNTVTFRSARLRWDGVVLDEAAIVLGPGDPLLLPWLRIRPSWRSLLGMGDGLPASVTAATCDGWTEGRIERADGGHRITGVWTDVDLKRCLHVIPVPGEITGHLQGRIDLRIANDGDDRRGSGVLRARDVAWSMLGVPRHLPTRADTGELQWDLDGARLAIRRFEAQNDELVMHATGTIDLTQPWAESPLDMTLTISPRPGMPQAHRDFFFSLAGGPPDRKGTRAFQLGGTVGRPMLGRP